MPTFPAALGDPLAQGYQVTPHAPHARTDMEDGPMRVRARFTGSPAEVALAWSWTAAQLDTFRSFYDVDLSQGVSWFSIDLRLGASMQTVDALFAEAPRIEAERPGRWKVSATLLVRSFA